MSIRYKLVLIFVLIAAIPMAAIGVLGYFNAKDALTNSTIAGLRAVSEFREGEVFLFLERFKIITRNYASDGYIRDRLEEIIEGKGDQLQSQSKLNQHLLNNKVPVTKSILFIDILTPDGRIAASSRPDRIGGFGGNKAYFIEGSKATYMSDIHTHDGKEQKLEVASPLFSRHNTEQPIGILINHFSSDSLSALLRGDLILQMGALTQMRGIGKTGETYLINQQGRMITDSLFIDNKKHDLKVDTYPVKAGIETGQEVYGLWSGYRGIPVVGASMIIAFDDFRWILISEQDQDEAFAPIYNLQKTLIIISLVMLALVIIIALATAHGFTRPLRRLMQSIEALGSGNFNAQVKGIDGNDEIGYLARAFNKMGQHLKATREELVEKNSALQELSIRDGLTELYNHRHLKKVIHYEFDRTNRYGSPLSIMILDLDYFKSVNDTYGHLFGDLVLHETARLLTDDLRSTDVVGRYGGEEFLIICPGTSLENAEFIAHKLRKNFSKHLFSDGTAYCQVTASIGVAMQKSDMQTYDDLIRCADEALYQAKENGRNRVFLDRQGESVAV